MRVAVSGSLVALGFAALASAQTLPTDSAVRLTPGQSVAGPGVLDLTLATFRLPAGWTATGGDEPQVLVLTFGQVSTLVTAKPATAAEVRQQLAGPIDLGRGVVLEPVTQPLELGDTLRLGRNSFSVVGHTRYQVASGGDPAVFITLLDAQKLQFDLAPPAQRVQLARGTSGSGRDTVNAVVARLQPDASPDVAAETVRRWKHLAAITQEQQELILTRSLVDRARRQIGLFTSLLLIVSAVIIALIIYTMTMEKLKQIATLKLIGAPDRTIVAMIVQQALALGFIGFVTGATLIFNIKDYFPRRVVLDADNVASLAAIVFLVCLLSSALGVRAAAPGFGTERHEEGQLIERNADRDQATADIDGDDGFAPLGQPARHGAVQAEDGERMRPNRTLLHDAPNRNVDEAAEDDAQHQIERRVGREVEFLQADEGDLRQEKRQQEQHHHRGEQREAV